jgi:hypothetical protein
MKTKSNPPTPVSAPTYEQTADRARQLWEKNGTPEGRDVEFWLEAERQLRTPAPTPSGRRSSSASSKIGDGDTIREKTDRLLDSTGEPGNRSVTGLNLDHRSS